MDRKVMRFGLKRDSQMLAGRATIAEPRNQAAPSVPASIGEMFNSSVMEGSITPRETAARGTTMFRLQRNPITTHPYFMEPVLMGVACSDAPFISPCRLHQHGVCANRDQGQVLRFARDRG